MPNSGRFKTGKSSAIFMSFFSTRSIIIPTALVLLVIGSIRINEPHDLFFRYGSKNSSLAVVNTTRAISFKDKKGTDECYIVLTSTLYFMLSIRVRLTFVVCLIKNDLLISIGSSSIHTNIASKLRSTTGKLSG